MLAEISGHVVLGTLFACSNWVCERKANSTVIILDSSEELRVNSSCNIKAIMMMDSLILKCVKYVPVFIMDTCQRKVQKLFILEINKNRR